MATAKRRAFIPVLPAVGLAAAVAGPVAQQVGWGAMATPLSTDLVSHTSPVAGLTKTPAREDGRGTGKPDGDDRRHQPRRPIHRPKKGTTNPPATTTSTTADPPATTTSTTADPPATTTSTTADPPATTTSTTADPPATTTSTTADPPATTTSTTADPPATTTSTTAAPTTTTTSTTAAPTSTTTSTTAAPTTTTSTTAAPTTTTTTPPQADVTITEQFTQIVNTQPLALKLTAANASGATHIYTVTVDVKGSHALPPYVNVNSDTIYAPLPGNWTCAPTEYDSPTTDNVFTCTVTLGAGSSTTVMVTTGSTFLPSDKGSTVSVVTTVTKETNPGAAPLPATVTATGTVG